MEPHQSLLLATVPLTVLFVFLSLIKSSLRSLSRVSLRRVAESENGTVKRLLDEYDDTPVEFILHIQVLIQMSLIGIAMLGTSASIIADLKHPIATAAVGLCAFVLAFEQFFPRYVMIVNRERLVTMLLPAYGRILKPIGEALSWPTLSLYRRLFRSLPEADKTDGEVSHEQIRAFIDVGEQAGILDEDESEMLEGIFDFGDTVVREVMTPRVDMVSIELTRTVAELRDLFIESKHSRVVVYKERVDNIEGVVYIKDILAAWREGKEDDTVGTLMKPCVFVPETKAVASLLKEFQRTRVTFAAVVDEYGGTSGLVTMEDLLEEIVGDIQDEYETTQADVVEAPGGGYVVSGKVDIERLEEIFDLEREETDFDTVAGLVFAALGRVPLVGEEFSRGPLRFKVVDADRRRINKVRVALITPSDESLLGQSR